MWLEGWWGEDDAKGRVSRTKVGQFLVLMNLPEKDRRKYKQIAGLREYQFRRRYAGGLREAQET